MNNNNEKQINKLFIAEYENVKNWTKNKRSILSQIKNDDFYLIFKTGKNSIPSTANQQTIKDMGEHKIVLSVEALDDNDYVNFMLGKILKYINPETFIYFLDMDSIYDKIVEKLNAQNITNIKFCKDYRYGRSIKPNKKILMGKKNQENNQIQNTKTSPNKTTKENKENEEENSDVFNYMHEVIIPDVYTKETDIQSNNASDYDEGNQDLNELDKKKNIILEKETQEEKQSTDTLTMSVDDIDNYDLNSIIGGTPPEEIKEPIIDNTDNLTSKKDNPILNIEKATEKEPFRKPRNIKEEKKHAIDIDVSKNIDNGDRMQNGPKIQEQMSKIHNSSNNTASKMNSPINTNGSSPPPMGRATGGLQGNKPNNNGRQIKPGGMGNKGFGNKQNQPSTDALSIQEIEKLIFGAKQEVVSFDKTYSEVDAEKAKLIEVLMQRLITNINKYAPKLIDYKFTHGKYLELITTLLKSVNYDDFMAGWDIIEPGYPIGLDEKTYVYLSDEARYYAKVCETLYENDAWS